ncbi:MAG: biosynthetic peptidoglycan transglycosylase, partial [Gammaproteobacteria bacterium]
LSLPEIGKWLPRATIAAEDARFFRHPGYDLAEVVAALERRAANQERLRGASTLTQQLAKNLFLDSERTLARKLRELLYAVEMEHTLGKRRILELYLNIVDWGSGLYGAKRAAEKYFGIAPADLMPEQAAWLASLLTNPRLALERQQRTGRIDSERVGWILGRMRGLSAAEREQALVRLLEITAP